MKNCFVFLINAELGSETAGQVQKRIVVHIENGAIFPAWLIARASEGKRGHLDLSGRDKILFG